AYGCGAKAHLPVSAGGGPRPQLPAPDHSLVPLVTVVTARGCAPGQTPVAAAGTTVTALATGLQHPRWVYVLPNGDVLGAETAAPERPEEGKGIKGRAMTYFMKKAGSPAPSANRITLLRDADGDGVPELKQIFLDNLNSPF